MSDRTVMVLSQEFVQQVANYLSGRPYSEVSKFMQALEKGVQRLSEEHLQLIEAFARGDGEYLHQVAERFAANANSANGG